VDYIDVARDMERWRPLVNAVMNFRVPCKEMNLVTSWDTCSFSRRILRHWFE